MAAGRPVAGMLLTRVVPAHALLLGATPFIQSAADIGGAWVDSTPLLIVLLAGSLLGLVLYRARQARLGGILMLAFLSTAAYMHARMLSALLDVSAPPEGHHAPFYLFGVLLLALGLSAAFGALLSFAALRDIHRQTDTPEHSTTS